MWTTIALAALALAGGQRAQLSLTNVRTTHGLLGPARADDKFLPGDSLVLSFDIEGARIDAGGKLLYSIGMEVTDRDSKVLFKQEPRELEAKVAAASKRVPAAASLQIGTDQPAGDYTLKVTVTDRASKASQEVTRSYQVLPKAFGLVRLLLTSDPDGKLPAAFLRQGKAGYVNFSAVGFERDKDKKQPHLVVVMRVLDENGRSSLKPSTGEVTADVAEKALAHPMQFALELRRAGRFTIELKATDKISGESATLSFPVTVKKSE